MSYNSHGFWKAMQIWIKNSHVVNRRLSGVVQLFTIKLLSMNISFDDILQNLSRLDYDLLSSEIYKYVLDSIDCQSNSISLSEDEFNANLCESLTKNYSSNIYLVIQKLLPRNDKYKRTFRFILLDTHLNVVSFINVSEKNRKLSLSPIYPYSFTLVENEILLNRIYGFPDDISMEWLFEKLLPKVLKWASSDILNKNNLTEGSLNLISLEEYNDTYQKLKLKYGKNIVDIWPETTDPSKFVYEDVAIAAYLLLLWKAERQNYETNKMQSFIDLGCGNGLLVYILCSEGHTGKGLDIRKRGIWDIYPEFVKLQVETIVPNNNCIYKDVDWIIGNHSDELTPWIPVIAAKSSYDSKFFLLPCCAYEFNGQKYQRKNSSKSQYNEYLEYIKEICNVCCINTSVDRLKIPSTKRTCFIGTSRSYPREKTESQLYELNKYVKERCKNTSDINEISVENDNVTFNLKIRESIEKVKNCTKIQKNVVDDIVNLIFSKLLMEENILNGYWNSGCSLSLTEIVKLIPSELLKFLKNECGGLQTLLKNNHNIFEVISGNVKLRYPRTKSEVIDKLSNKNKVQNYPNKVILTQKPCWFYQNHPNGCPLSAELCSYLHIK